MGIILNIIFILSFEFAILYYVDLLPKLEAHYYMTNLPLKRTSILRLKM